MGIQDSVKRNLLIAQVETLFGLKEGSLGNLETDTEKFQLLQGFAFTFLKLGALKVVSGMAARKTLSTYSAMIDQGLELPEQAKEDLIKANDIMTEASIYNLVCSTLVELRDLATNDTDTPSLEACDALFKELKDVLNEKEN